MKTKLFISQAALLMVVLFNNNFTLAGNIKNIDLDSVTVINDFKNQYRSGDYYFGGQPSFETLCWLQTEGVNIVINLRTEKEMDQFEEYAFNEKNIVNEMNMLYYIIPVDGVKDYNYDKLKEFAKVLENNPGKVYIHCGSCYRVTYFIMAYLIEYKNYPLNDVLSFGMKLKYNMPLEGLLNKKITMKIE